MADRALQQVRTHVWTGTQIAWKGLDELEIFLQTQLKAEGTFVAWMEQGLCFGLWQEGRLFTAEGQSLELAFLDSMRIFNRDEELYLWRTSGEFAWRLRREDDTGEAALVVDGKGLLWGQVEKEQGAFSLLADKERKLQMLVPKAAQKDSLLYLITRNYVHCNERTGQAGYCDSRFMEWVEGRWGK